MDKGRRNSPRKRTLVPGRSLCRSSTGYGPPSKIVMIHAALRRFDPRGSRAYSLIELLVCVVIIAILTTISLCYYQGAIDQSDLKYTAPGLARSLEKSRESAQASGEIITFEFEIGSGKFRETHRKGSETTTVDRELVNEGIIKRPIRFLGYEWSDGSKTPVTFTFFPNADPQGGTLKLGTRWAETTIKVQNGHVICPL